MPTGGRGQLLMPWPNRIRDGQYSFDDRSLQLALSETAPGQRLARPGALGGLVAGGAVVGLGVADLPADGPERLPLDPRPARALRRLGRRPDRDADRDQPVRRARAVRQRRAPLPARRATAPVDGWELTLPASTRLLDRRPADPRRRGAGRGHGVRLPRLPPGPRHRARPRVRRRGPRRRRRRDRRPCCDPASGDGVALWMDDRHHWIQVYSAEQDPVPRRALAVEPMTAPADAFRSGRDLVVLAPAGYGRRRVLGFLGDPGADLSRVPAREGWFPWQCVRVSRRRRDQPQPPRDYPAGRTAERPAPPVAPAARSGRGRRRSPGCPSPRRRCRRRGRG